MIPRMTSFAYTPGASAPVTSRRRTFSGSSARHCDARTSRTCEVPIPNASAPNAPCVDVWLSPHAIVMPGCVSPSSGPITWTMPCSREPRSWSGTPKSRQFCWSEVSISSARASAKGRARLAVGTMWSTVATVRDGNGTPQPRVRSISKACGLVTSWTRWRPTKSCVCPVGSFRTVWRSQTFENSVAAIAFSVAERSVPAEDLLEENLHRLPGAPRGRLVVADHALHSPGGRQPVRVGVRERVDGARVVHGLVVDLRVLERLLERRARFGLHHRVVRAVEEQEFRLDGPRRRRGRVHRPAVEADDARERGAAVGESLRGRAAEAEADRGHFPRIDAVHLQELLEAGLRPLGHQRLSVERSRELSRLLRVFGDDPLTVHVHGEGDVAHRGELYGAPFRVRVEPPPLGNHEDTGELSLRGLRVVVREKAFQLRARVLVHDGLRDDLREGGVRGEERGGGNGERLKRFHLENASNSGTATQPWRHEPAPAG